MAKPLRGELWLAPNLLILDSIVGNSMLGASMEERQEAAIKQLLEDARWAFSGMLYGFNILWKPPSPERNIKETLEIQLIGTIPRGDPRLKVISTVWEDDILYVLLEYQMDETQQRRLEAWRSQALPFAAGSGTGDIFEEQPYRTAMEQAIREAMRSYFRARYYSRPRLIQGKAGLLDFPKAGFWQASIQASVKLALDIPPPEPYSVY
ncbi:MAG: hypothetical protein B0D92_01680 [Spirochaeta sp. LUC14_002_19_P3]|nr:MAG: hypothetical protein B0D92_01680 [Spirochaeta sp. LUC14_002_19_P3]